MRRFWFSLMISREERNYLPSPYPITVRKFYLINAKHGHYTNISCYMVHCWDIQIQFCQAFNFFFQWAEGVWCWFISLLKPFYFLLLLNFIISEIHRIKKKQMVFTRNYISHNVCHKCINLWMNYIVILFTEPVVMISINLWRNEAKKKPHNKMMFMPFDYTFRGFVKNGQEGS